MAVVRDVTLRAPIWDNSVISASVIPSAKYSWLGSFDRLVSGRTTKEWMAGTLTLEKRRERTPPRSRASSAAAAATTAAATIAIWRERELCALLVSMLSASPVAPTG